MRWTNAQQKVIDTRNKNLLVSAAAGSGKTAVLVERIISMISEGEHPMDIDHLLVVTFTNAAAAEMRTRIGKAIDEKLVSQPDNLHLQKQSSLLQSAQITTIHSFCLYVLRNYFHRIDLDPAFSIAEESEITLMKSDVISELLERWYEEGREDFHAFIESYSYSKSDAPVEDLILQLFNFSMSDPWPKDWIENKKKMFDIKSLEDMTKAPWMKELLAYIDVVLGDLLDKNARALEVCNGPAGPTAYLPAILSDRSLLERLRQAKTYEQLAKQFSEISFDRLSSKREEGVDPQNKDRVKGLREEIKKGLKDLNAQYFFQVPDEMWKDMRAVSQVMQVLFELTLEFMEEFAKKKEEKNLIDFNDLEHFALKILVQKDEETGMAVPTQAALELSEQFEEILIDEYQDSNMVQETILKSISREDCNTPNRFMVGDVKQSIYKFRLAMPEIFMEKYETYSSLDMLEDGQLNSYQRIDLDQNFRSRKTVLDYVNQIFEQIMQRPVGGIIYDASASLKYGGLYDNIGNTDNIDNKDNKDNVDNIQDCDEVKANFNKLMNRISYDTELLLVTEENDSDDQENTEENSITSEVLASDGDAGSKSSRDEEDPDDIVYTKKEIEARAIAKKIKELTDPKTGMLVFDKNSKGYRRAMYRDIVILLRSMSNWSEVFVNTLMQEGIPAYADTGTGYFRTLEIMTILNMLRIIDNPRQDISLAGVLYSPIVGLTTNELALIRTVKRNVSFYSAVVAYAEEGSNLELKEKLHAFLMRLNTFREMVNYKPIHELIEIVLDQTGYYYYVSAMPGGDKRKANIDMLIAQAVRFEKGSYSGLFHFIRYIEKLHKYEVDFGEAATAGEQDNTVRIMSIHKSKGLEFPIVFVAGMSKQFNTQDIRGSIVLHNELGVGPEYVDSVLRTKVPTLLKKVIQKKIQIENLGEELRVLYVAMTRAKEKLILTGYLKSLEEIKGKEFSFFEILSAKSYLDWVLPATINRIGWTPEEMGDQQVWKQDDISVTVIRKEELLKEEISKQIFLRKDEEELLKFDPNEVYNQALREEVNNRFNFVYPYTKDAGLKVKMTVSELKKLGQFQDEEQSVNLYQQQGKAILEGASQERTGQEGTVREGIGREGAEPEETNATIPDFIRQTKVKVSGTDRGTLYHKVLELLDLTKVKEPEDIQREMDRLVLEKHIRPEDIKKVKLDYIYKFANSTVADRMRKAQSAGCLYKEKQFVMGIPASELMQEIDSEELVLIQGIIDVFFEEDGELVLLDYKSDVVSNEEQLVGRYKVQLQYYRKALEQIRKEKVKEMIIYSLPLGKEIRIED